jgi:hypothetical protein
MLDISKGVRSHSCTSLFWSGLEESKDGSSSGGRSMKGAASCHLSASIKVGFSKRRSGDKNVACHVELLGVFLWRRD